MKPVVEVDKLTKSYGSKRGITSVSFSVNEGEAFGFLGPNGAGKTTTIRLLMALLRADSGSARIAGMDCWSQSVAIKRVVGYVPGEPSLDPGMTGGQILQYFAHLRGGVDQAYLKRLVALEVSESFDVPEQGIEALVQSPIVSRLRILGVRTAEIGLSGAHADLIQLLERLRIVTRLA